MNYDMAPEHERWIDVLACSYFFIQALAIIATALLAPITISAIPAALLLISAELYRTEHLYSLMVLVFVTLFAPLIAIAGAHQALWSTSDLGTLVLVGVLSAGLGLLATKAFNHETNKELVTAAVWTSSALAVLFAINSGVAYVLEQIARQTAEFSSSGPQLTSMFGTLVSQEIAFAVALLGFNTPIIHRFIEHEHEAKRMFWYALPAGIFLVLWGLVMFVLGQIIGVAA